MGKLEGKVAIVTGGNSGIGYASALRFIKEGAKVVISGRRQEALKEAFQNVEGDFTTVVADQGKIEENKKLIALAIQKYGKLDIIFHNAGVVKFAGFTDTSEEIFDESFDVNIKGPYFLTQFAVPHLNAGASLIFNITTARDRAWTTMSAYVASKGGLLSLIKALSAELAPQRIRVNAISPGFTETPAIMKTGMTEKQIEGLEEVLMPKILLGRPAQPEDMSNVVAFLASDEAAYITGEEITVDAGISLS
ncbi:SDR family NAD(P)-dependent oxidoreductase [Spongiimicrobium sp. 2-473A-2-J]|uniref:SDR family NAD(P)-dependent oxidoreductase n=1 Tax=Eudoraea algarum TaxID=3417568 RepID=UPI003D366400